MKLKWVGVLFVFFCLTASAQQSLKTKLQAAWKTFTDDKQLKYALAGLCVLDAQTGQVIFEKNSNIGMAPASTQKIITSIAAFEALGGSYQYNTHIGYTGNIIDGTLKGDLIIEGNGDPTLGTQRYESTKKDSVCHYIVQKLKSAGINNIEGDFRGVDKGFDINPVPGNWVWGDMGNYYGAGHWALNWNENVYDVFFQSPAQKGYATTIKAVEPEGSGEKLYNEVLSGNSNSGDESVIYAAPFSPFKLAQGSISSGKPNFKVSGSLSLADMNALTAMQKGLETDGITISGKLIPPSTRILVPDSALSYINDFTVIGSMQSPTLDSINYWLMKKSINLYAEALLRTIGLEKKGFGSTKNGLEWVDTFYTLNGFDKEVMHLYDGSGLSPENRITAFAMAKALNLAKTKSWYPSFYDALPVFNGMKLKSGTIGRVKCFAGYHTSKTGRQYSICFMVNNYNGNAGTLINKMYRVLDELK